MPTALNTLTGKQKIETIAKAMNVKPRLQVASKFIVRIMGLFVPVMREMPEMLYQYDRDYVFHSNKFEKRVGIKPISYVDDITKIVRADCIKR